MVSIVTLIALPLCLFSVDASATNNTTAIPFGYVTTDLIQYKNASNSKPELEVILDKLGKEWLKLLGPHKPSNFNISTESTVRVGSDIDRLTYRITGTTETPVDFPETDLQLVESFQHFRVEGIRMDTAKYESLLEKLSEPQSAKTGYSFTSDIWLEFQNATDRDALLQLLVPLWENILNVSNVEIRFVDEIPLMDVGTNNTDIRYQITTKPTGSRDIHKRLAASIPQSLVQKFREEVTKLGNRKMSFEPNITATWQPFVDILP